MKVVISVEALRFLDRYAFYPEYPNWKSGELRVHVAVKDYPEYLNTRPEIDRLMESIGGRWIGAESGAWHFKKCPMKRLEAIVRRGNYRAAGGRGGDSKTRAGGRRKNRDN